MADPVGTFFTRAWNARDHGVLDDLLAVPYPIRSVVGAEVTEQLFSVDDMRAHIEEWCAAFPDLQMSVVQRTDAPDGAAVLVRCTGTQDGPFLGSPPTGTSVAFTMAVFLDHDGERLLGHTTLVDRFTLRQQLGVPASS